MSLTIFERGLVNTRFGKLIIFDNDGNIRFYNKTLSVGGDSVGGQPKVGIGVMNTDYPKELLDVRGGIKIGEALNQNPNSIGGNIQWYGDSLRVYDGDNWRVIGYMDDIMDSILNSQSNSSGGIPSGLDNQTLRYNMITGEWEASNMITNETDRVGIGLQPGTSASEVLEVAGGIKIGESANSNPSGGHIQWNPVTSTLRVLMVHSGSL